MKNIRLNIDKALGTVSKEQVYAQEAKAMECIATLHNGCLLYTSPSPRDCS